MSKLPTPAKIGLIVAGVVLVKVGERDTSERAGVSARPDA